MSAYDKPASQHHRLAGAPPPSITSSHSPAVQTRRGSLEDRAERAALTPHRHRGGFRRVAAVVRVAV
jgi:hypothetical protein